MSEEWGPWIEHDGSNCPVKGMWVLALHDFEERNDPPGEIKGIYEGVAGAEGGSSWNWEKSRWCSRVVRYRVRKPKALQQLIQMVQNLPAPSKQYEDA